MSLKAIMRDMINTVIEKPSYHISHSLQRGLQIDMKREDSVISALLSRSDTYPSQLEYDIVMSFFPEDWRYPGYEKLEQSDRYWLKTLVEVPKEVEFGKPIFKFKK